MKTSLFLLCFIAAGLLLFACVAGPEIKPALDLNKKIVDCYYYNGHTYIFVSEREYWHPAEQRCEETGGHLVILDDTDEYLAMTSDLPKGSVNIQQTATGVRISLEDLKFNADSTVMQVAEKSKLAALQRLLAPFHDHTVLFIGHTAQWGSVDSCLELSRKRAQAIAAIFTADGTLRKEKVKTDGHGFFEPLADNATEEGMKKNRRVEIIILD